MKDHGSTPGPSSIAMRLQATMASLSRSEKQLALLILDRPFEAANMTITELSRAAGVSDATVTRFCRRLGLTGYAQLRLQLAAEADRKQTDLRPGLSLIDDISPDDTLVDIVRKTAYADIRAAEITISQLDLDQLGKLVEAVAGAGRVLVFGVGALGPVVHDIVQKLFRLGLNAAGFNDIHTALAAVSMTGSGDVVLVLSHSGRTVEGIELLTLAKTREAHGAVITSNPLSSAAMLARTVLVTAARDTPFRNGGMASRSAQQIILDCLYVALAHRQYDKTGALLATAHDALRNHRRER
ncbi:DNA-binding transcriptional regulator, MurR/RpiR family, contains HTH and SIS domains [Paracoccus isoporae]|uniref:DNA-binding transcriptional regulator, MurR/RpiR family, contains HTH and SIS domains n=1 Tax=Paracoccus isoporae TaxID=591205 RepID=A0A1G7DC02_9RHOB|nr:MurR/RpiR family transcriptional regulator [Paracoccus isoporae]SDE48275.1 DNA-binding transcriptional regulator, MurR/RpiR family, contains HTH and SIS domains [Paracoccus isoporae]